MQRLASYIHGPHSRLGLTAAGIVCVLDQAIKFWLIRFVFHFDPRKIVTLAPVLDLRLLWNSGISYGLFQYGSPRWQWSLFGFKMLAVVVLWAWLARTRSRLGALSLGLIIGGALGNAVDRFAYGAVADFVHFHVGTFSWYVFNVADAAIVAGVVGLLLESLFVGAVAADRHSAAP